MGKKNPILEKKYWEGYHTGFDGGFGEARDTAVAHFAVRLERLAQIPGLGPKRLQMIQEVLEMELTPEEAKQAERYIMQMREKNVKEAAKRVKQQRK